MFRCFSVFLVLLALALPMRAQSPVQELAQGEAAWKKDDYKAARIHFDRVLSARQSNPNIEQRARHGRGVARLELHDWSGAKSDLTRAVEIDPTDAGAFAARGMARKGLGDYSGLLIDAREAARLNPGRFASFEDDAKSTVLWRRMLLVFAGLAVVLLCLGVVPLARGVARITRAERDAKRAGN